MLVDTNFINFRRAAAVACTTAPASDPLPVCFRSHLHSVKNKLDLVQGMVECLTAQCTPCITDCVMAELEKLGTRYRVSLLVAKDPRVERLPCVARERDER